MVPDDPIPEWLWWLNNLRYTIGVLIVRWLMPLGIREAAYYGELRELKRSYPHNREDWLRIDEITFRQQRGELQRQYRVMDYAHTTRPDSRA
jgi:hypothetical protein